MYEEIGSNKLYFSYDVSGSPFTLNYNGTYYYYDLNWRGDVIALFGTDNLLKARYKYDAWGKLLGIYDANDNLITSSTHIGVINPLRYRGYYYDSESGFYFLGSRYYDPQTFRFFNADSTGLLTSTPMSVNNKNLFTYCNNNPVMLKDVNGQIAITATILLIAGAGVLVTSIVSGVISACTGGTFWGGAANGLITSAPIAALCVVGAPAVVLLPIAAASGLWGYLAQTSIEDEELPEWGRVTAAAGGMFSAGIGSVVSEGISSIESIGNRLAGELVPDIYTSLMTSVVDPVIDAIFDSATSNNSNVSNGNNDKSPPWGARLKNVYPYSLLKGAGM